MPRQQRRSAFDLDRDVRADSPTPEPATPRAATASGLLPKLDDSLPPLEATPTPSETDRRPTDPAGDATPGPSRTAGTEGASDEPGEGKQATARPRGAGGRPAGARKEPESITKVPARVPAELYDKALPLVTGIGRPSWGQLVAWTCQDSSTEVLAELLEPNQPDASRRPRGQNRQGTAGLQVTARLNADEFTAFDQVMQQATRKAESTVTRTKVVIAALTVATKAEATRTEAAPG